MDSADDMLINESARRQASQAMIELRKETLNIYNRIHSIVEDVLFVEEVHRVYLNLPILRKL